MEGHCSTGQSPLQAVDPMEEEEEEERGGGGGDGVCSLVQSLWEAV